MIASSSLTHYHLISFPEMIDLFGFSPQVCYVYIYIYIYFLNFWLHWIFVAVCRLSLVAANGGYSSLRCTGFSLRWLLIAEHGL